MPRAVLPVRIWPVRYLWELHSRPYSDGGGLMVLRPLYCSTGSFRKHVRRWRVRVQAVADVDAAVMTSCQERQECKAVPLRIIPTVAVPAVVMVAVRAKCCCHT